VRKTNKSKFFVLMILIISTFLATVLQVGASRGGAMIVDVSEFISIEDSIDIDITFYHSDNIPSEIVAQIERSVLGIADNSEDMMIQSFSILCIFGHNWSTGSTIIVQHGAYSTNPRCREIIRSVEFCTRCSVTIIFSERTRRITCC